MQLLSHITNGFRLIDDEPISTQQVWADYSQEGASFRDFIRVICNDLDLSVGKFVFTLVFTASRNRPRTYGIQLTADAIITTRKNEVVLPVESSLNEVLFHCCSSSEFLYDDLAVLTLQSSAFEGRLMVITYVGIIRILEISNASGIFTTYDETYMRESRFVELTSSSQIQPELLSGVRLVTKNRDRLTSGWAIKAMTSLKMTESQIPPSIIDNHVFHRTGTRNRRLLGQMPRLESDDDILIEITVMEDPGDEIFSDWDNDLRDAFLIGIGCSTTTELPEGPKDLSEIESAGINLLWQNIREIKDELCAHSLIVSKESDQETSNSLRRIGTSLARSQRHSLGTVFEPVPPDRS